MQTLSLTASKKIADLGVEVVAEKYWCEHWDARTETRIWEVIPHDKDDVVNAQIPAPNLQELLTVLPSIGEKLGWGLIGRNITMPKEPKRVFNEAVNTRECLEEARRLTDLYLSGGMEAVSHSIIELVDNNNLL